MVFKKILIYFYFFRSDAIITDKKQATNVEHVYSAGDITGGVKQWIVACGEGAVAAISAYNDLNL